MSDDKYADQDSAQERDLEAEAAEIEERQVREEIAIRPPTMLAPVPKELTIEELVAQVALIDGAMDAVMEKDVHYGIIPGTGSKPTLLKPGAEKLGLLFRLGPRFDVEETRSADGHLDIRVTCRLYHIPTGNLVGEGIGSCSTREAKYAYTKGMRVCPTCGAEQIIKGKQEYGGGWLCWKKKGGCGATFADNSVEGEAFADTDVSRVPRKPEELADFYNTVLKMAVKRAHVAAILYATGASDRFTQDVEDMPTVQRDQHGYKEKEGHKEFATPKSWASINSIVAQWGEEFVEDWRTFTEQAMESQYETSSSKEMTPEQRKDALRIAAGAVVKLHELAPGDFPPPNREACQEAWASVLNGAMLPGPHRSMGPEEAAANQ